MIKVLIGDMFESKAQTLVNTVNCVGVMGKGVALEFKKRFPEMFEDYERRCQRHEVKLGQPYLFKRLLPPWILNFPTKAHWRAVTNLQDIIHGLEYLLAHYQQWSITSLAVPPLGCGNGQLEWRVVGPTLYRYFRRMEIPVEIYAPHGTPHAELQPSFLGANGNAGDLPVAMPKPQFIKPEWVAIVDVLDRIESQPYHWPVGRTMFQKIAYVVTEEGLDTGLDYRRGSYGPYAPEVKPMLGRLMNNGLIEEEQLGEKMLRVRPGRTFADAKAAYRTQLDTFEPVLQKTTDLFLRVQNTHQAELVSTVLFAARQLRHQSRAQPSELDVLHAVMEWKIRRRPPIEAGEVALTIRNLAALGWLDVAASEDLPLPEEELLADA
jgi:O-acetyl-ADP-ribose deacetylase (regulator of RNase III)